MPKPAARVRLTERTVAALKPEAGKRYAVFDATVPGFAIRVTETGHKSFAVITRFEGRQRWITLGTVGRTELAEARKRARKMLARVEAGEAPEPKQADTFAAVATRFIAEYAQPRNRTWRDTERILRVYCAPWASRDITTIDRRDVRERLETVARDHGPIMSNRTLSAARKLFSWSLERDIIPANPAAKMEPVAKETSRDRVLSDAELRAFWRATVEMPTPWGPYFRMLALTGQRLSEVASMRWQDIDFGRALWTLPREATKTDRLHEVPLSPAAMDIPRGLPRFSGPFVFTTSIYATSAARRPRSTGQCHRTSIGPFMTCAARSRPSASGSALPRTWSRRC